MVFSIKAWRDKQEKNAMKDEDKAEYDQKGHCDGLFPHKFDKSCCSIIIGSVPVGGLSIKNMRPKNICQCGQSPACESESCTPKRRCALCCSCKKCMTPGCWQIYDHAGRCDSHTESETWTDKAVRIVNGMDLRLEAVKHDDGKIQMSLIPTDALEEIARVFMFGAKKYSPHNWRKGFNYTRVYDAAQRHLMAFLQGENKDPESGLLHLAHAAVCIIFLISFQLTGTGVDDR